MKKYNISILSALAGLVIVLFGQSASAQPLPTPTGHCFLSYGATGGSGAEGTVEHWDKIVFSISSFLPILPGVNFKGTHIPFNTELDIKVLDDPDTVADLRGKVVDFVCNKLPGNSCNTDGQEALRRLIKIISVEYAIICGADSKPTETAG